MSAAQALKAARAEGIELDIDGEDLLWAAPEQPPMAVLDLLKRHKTGIVRLLRLGGDDEWSAEDCMSTYAAWRQSTCRVCGEGDYTDDPIGIFLDGKGGDVALHQACWSAWATPAAPAWANPPAAPAEDTDCLVCGGGPDGGDTWKVFAGSEDADGWIYSRCRDGYVELWREEERGGEPDTSQDERALPCRRNLEKRR